MSTPVVFVADVDLSPPSNVEKSQNLTNASATPRLDLTPSKLSSEHFGLPEGENFASLLPTKRLCFHQR